jgi:hypothetical protein
MEGANKGMEPKLLLKLINTSEKEKMWIESFVKDYGFDTLVKNIDAAAISNRAKQILLSIHQILHSGNQAIESLASITEIPAKSIRAAMNNDNLHELMEHPERLDLDIRQSYSFRCLNEVYTSYLKDTEHLHIQYISEDQGYEHES